MGKSVLVQFYFFVYLKRIHRLCSLRSCDCSNRNIITQDAQRNEIMKPVNKQLDQEQILFRFGSHELGSLGCVILSAVDLGRIERRQPSPPLICLRKLICCRRRSTNFIGLILRVHLCKRSGQNPR